MPLFGKYTLRWLPVMTAKCISFLGNSVGGTQFIDKMHDMEIEGNRLHQFRTIMNFFTRNLRKVQVEKEFNVPTAAPNATPTLHPTLPAKTICSINKTQTTIQSSD